MQPYRKIIFCFTKAKVEKVHGSGIKTKYTSLLTTSETDLTAFA